MCIVSNIGDQYGTFPWKPTTGDLPPYDWPYRKRPEAPTPFVLPDPPPPPKNLNGLQERAVVDWLKKLDKILIAARAFDEATGQPDCETAEKMSAIKALADQFGVEMEFFS